MNKYLLPELVEIIFGYFDNDDLNKSFFETSHYYKKMFPIFVKYKRWNWKQLKERVDSDSVNMHLKKQFKHIKVLLNLDSAKILNYLSLNNLTELSFEDVNSQITNLSHFKNLKILDFANFHNGLIPKLPLSLKILTFNTNFCCSNASSIIDKDVSHEDLSYLANLISINFENNNKNKIIFLKLPQNIETINLKGCTPFHFGFLNDFLPYKNLKYIRYWFHDIYNPGRIHYHYMSVNFYRSIFLPEYDLQNMPIDWFFDGGVDVSQIGNAFWNEIEEFIWSGNENKYGNKSLEDVNNFIMSKNPPNMLVYQK